MMKKTNILKIFVKFLFKLIFTPFGFVVTKKDTKAIFKPMVDLKFIQKNLSEIDVNCETDLSIFVFSHKQVQLPELSFYTGVSLAGKDLLGFHFCDSATEDNISHLNHGYSELTGIYSIWKSKNFPEIIGVAHYRRYLNVLPLSDRINGFFCANWLDAKGLISDRRQKQIINHLLKQYDIILPRSFLLSQTVADAYENDHQGIGWAELISELNNLYGKNNHGLQNERRFFTGNLFIARREVFDKYCSDLFPILQNVYDQIGEIPLLGNVRYEPCRYPAYLAERFMSAFVNAHRLRVYEADQIFIDDL